MAMGTQKQEVGTLGEKIACNFLKSKGYEIVDRNYRKKFGEIDIICTKGKDLVFVEVKSVSLDNVSRETASDAYRPEDNVHKDKIKRVERTIQVYLQERRIPDQQEWSLVVITVEIDTKNKTSRVKLLKDFAF
jgi:putative endonuclease